MQRGIPVSGVELSPAMIDQLRKRIDEATVPVVRGDMATACFPGEFTLVYLVYNTISNLLTQAEQVGCFRNAARHLAPGGRLMSLIEQAQQDSLHTVHIGTSESGVA
jgi:hypothetical protein